LNLSLPTLPAVPLQPSQSADVRPELVVDHLQDFRVYLAEFGLLMFLQINDQRLSVRPPELYTLLPCHAQLRQQAVVEPAAEPHVAVQLNTIDHPQSRSGEPPLSDFQGERSVKVFEKIEEISRYFYWEAF
jgi:hypothetical protein